MSLSLHPLVLTVWLSGSRAQEPAISEQELEALRSVFALFDTDGTGEIDSKEFATILSKIGRDPSEGNDGLNLRDSCCVAGSPALSPHCAAATLLRDVDPDMSGKISFEEFVKLLNKSRSALRPLKLLPRRCAIERNCFASLQARRPRRQTPKCWSSCAF